MTVAGRIWGGLVYGIKSLFMKKMIVILLNVLSLGLGFAVSGNFSKAMYSYFALVCGYTLFIISGLGFYYASVIMFLTVVGVYFYNIIYPLFLETVVFRKFILMTFANLSMITLMILYVVFARMFIFDTFIYQNNFGDKIKKGEIVFSYKSMPKIVPEVLIIENGGYTYLTTKSKAQYYKVDLEKSYRGYPVYILWSREFRRIGNAIQ